MKAIDLVDVFADVFDLLAVDATDPRISLTEDDPRADRGPRRDPRGRRGVRYDVVPARRCPKNPILTPAMVTPSRDDLKVVGVFNPAALRIDDEVVLLVRVAEAPREVSATEVAAPIFDARTGRLEIRRFRRDAPGVDADSDSREFEVDGQVYLTSISHIRLARSRDGIDFSIEPEPLLAPAEELEAYGVEDPRATVVDGEIMINYTAVSQHGIATALAAGPELRKLTRRGVMFAPPNRDVTIFPERIAGRYVALHRPMPHRLGTPAIWLASSPDGMCWGEHRLVATARPGMWDDLKVGGGAPPVKVRWRGRDAWLAIYHGVRAEPMTYALGALLLDADDPGRVLGRSRTPVLAPETPYERDGFFGNVVFTCGLVEHGDALRIYYGAADGVTAMADVSIPEILEDLA